MGQSGLPYGIKQQSIGLANEYVRNPGQFSRQIQNGVLDGRMKLQNLGNVWEDKLPEFEILDAKTVEQEMNEPQKNAGGPEL